MKKIISYFAFFLMAYIVFIIATMPAQFALNQVTLPKTIKVSGVSGSIWHANIDYVSTHIIDVTDVNAELSVLSLFTLSPSFDITLGDPLKRGPEGYLTLNVASNSLAIENAKINIAVNDVLKNAQLPIDLTAKGYIELEIEKFSAGKPMCQTLSGKLNWPKAKIKAFDQAVALGTLKATLGCENGALAVAINENNNLGLSYTAYMRQVGKFTGDGFIKPGTKFPENVKPILSFLGKPDGQGRYRLSL